MAALRAASGLLAGWLEAREPPSPRSALKQAGWWLRSCPEARKTGSRETERGANVSARLAKRTLPMFVGPVCLRCGAIRTSAPVASPGERRACVSLFRRRLALRSRTRVQLKRIHPILCMIGAGGENVSRIEQIQSNNIIAECRGNSARNYIN